MPEKFFVTTPIYYVNAKPHIGSAYTTIAADVLARYHRLKGDNVFFLVGTDENAQKNAEVALKAAPNGGRAAVQKYVDDMSALWRQAWVDLKISNDDFIRTTEERHIKYVEKFWQDVAEKGDIYKGFYEGLYCTGCESFKTETELVDGLCPDHKRAPTKVKEENYFFRLSKYRDAVLSHIEKYPEFIQPESRRNEIIQYIQKYEGDLSISRKTQDWGIPVPGDDSQSIYVWFDALLNYVSAKPADWPADLHLMGKDIIKFHCFYWPAMLLSAGLKLPKTVFAHGFFTVDGQKMSKTLGNVIDPAELVAKFGVDATRYLLLAEIPFGSDGDISWTKLGERYEADLVNGLGNLCSRVLTLASKQPVKFDYTLAGETEKFVAQAWKDYASALDSNDITSAVQVLISLIKYADKFVDDNEPWKLIKNDADKFQKVISVLLELLRHLAWLFTPFTPGAGAKILASLGVPPEFDVKDSKKWGILKGVVEFKKAEALFPRLTSEKA